MSSRTLLDLYFKIRKTYRAYIFTYLLRTFTLYIHLISTVLYITCEINCVANNITICFLVRHRRTKVRTLR